MKVIVVFGTRPEAIKLSPVIHELKRRSVASTVRTLVCVTAQHRHMLDQVLSLFDIECDYDLNVMEENQSLSRVAGAVLSQLQLILEKERPDWVLVQGDTVSVAAASLAAFYARLRVAHVEAGLRTHNKWGPFPEEINRRVVGLVADLHFAPTKHARQNLLDEGVPPDHVLITGNPVIDALHWVAGRPPTTSVSGLNNDGQRLILVTAHRRENFGAPLENICLALRDIADYGKDTVRIVYPVHLNPSVQEPVHRVLGSLGNVSLLPPLDYPSMVHLMKRAYLVLTDSGGIQEEAPSLGKPVLVLRDVTERPEAVAAGTALLVGTEREGIVAATTELMDNPPRYERMAQAINPYGDGHASARIVAGLLGEPVEQFMPPDPTE